MKGPVRYRDYHITRSVPAARDLRWTWWSEEYTGPEDPRFGMERTIEACLERIDEVEEELSVPQDVPAEQQQEGG